MKAFSKRAVIIYGPPGSGKGTQAELLAKKYNFIHFDTGNYLESLFLSSRTLRDPFLIKEKKLFDSGKLNTPAWVLKIVAAATQRIARAGFGIVFSGSPRTIFEAFGDKKHNGLLSTLEKFYSKKNITVLKLDVRDQTSIHRNGRRLICSVCGLPILAVAKIKTCAFCAGRARKRTLDSPAVIRVRLKEYRERTYPIVARMKKNGFEIKEINGEPLPYKVFAQITRVLKLKAGQ